MTTGNTDTVSPRTPISMVMTRMAIPILGMLGMGISGYLGFSYWLGEEPMCFGGSGCGHVFTSPYSHIWGIPLPLLGLAMYVVLTGLGLLVLKLRGNARPFVALSIYTVALAGTLYSACLTYLQFAVIHALCTWCLASALVVTSIFILSLRGLFDYTLTQ